MRALYSTLPQLIVFYYTELLSAIMIFSLCEFLVQFSFSRFSVSVAVLLYEGTSSKNEVLYRQSLINV